MQYLDIDISRPLGLPSTGGLEAVHRFDNRQVEAINTALGSGRPLLVRGDPGVGKSQLARAAAAGLGWRIVSHVVDARTEPRDLLWQLDAVARLADAQVAGTGVASGQGHIAARDPREPLDYMAPSVLWWALNWDDAATQAKRARISPPPQDDNLAPDAGCVALIDEIDKGETDVPNGLLEALGSGRFQPPGRPDPVQSGDRPPLVVITTNEERTLPDAFVRRCIVLHLALPAERSALVPWLIERGGDHFLDNEQDGRAQTSGDVLLRAAELLADDRDAADQRGWRPRPGQAEYLDLVRAVVRRRPFDPAEQLNLLEVSARYVLRKDPGAQS